MRRTDPRCVPKPVLLLHYSKSSSLDSSKPITRFCKPSLKILLIISLLPFFEDNRSPGFIFTFPTVYCIGLGKWQAFNKHLKGE